MIVNHNTFLCEFREFVWTHPSRRRASKSEPPLKLWENEEDAEERVATPRKKLEVKELDEEANNYLGPLGEAVKVLQFQERVARVLKDLAVRTAEADAKGAEEAKVEASKEGKAAEAAAKVQAAEQAKSAEEAAKAHAAQQFRDAAAAELASAEAKETENKKNCDKAQLKKQKKQASATACASGPRFFPQLSDDSETDEQSDEQPLLLETAQSSAQSSLTDAVVAATIPVSKAPLVSSAAGSTAAPPQAAKVPAGPYGPTSAKLVSSEVAMASMPNGVSCKRIDWNMNGSTSRYNKSFDMSFNGGHAVPFMASLEPSGAGKFSDAGWKGKHTLKCQEPGQVDSTWEMMAFFISAGPRTEDVLEMPRAALPHDFKKKNNCTLPPGKQVFEFGTYGSSPTAPGCSGRNYLFVKKPWAFVDNA